MRRAAKKDANHAQIVRELKQVGACVLELYRVGQGCPDVLVAWRGYQVLVEIKQEKGKLTDDEIAFFQGWYPGLAIIARCSEDVIDWFTQRLAERVTHD